MYMTPPNDSGDSTRPLSEKAALLLTALRDNKGRLKKEQLDDIARQQGWASEVLEEAKSELLQKNLAAQARGRLGGLREVEPEPPAEMDTSVLENAKKRERDQTETYATQVERDERSLYPRLETWARNAGYPIVSLVADQRPEGRSVWENPDLLLVDVLPLTWSVTPQFDVTAVEVKLSLNPQAVWQAAHYRTFAHFVYLACLEDPDDMRKSIHEGRLFSLAATLGLGLLSIHPVGKGLRVDEIHSPGRQMPEPSAVDRILVDYEKWLLEADREDNLQAPWQIITGHLSNRHAAR